MSPSNFPNSPLHGNKSSNSGFSLVELAIVLMIIGTLMSGVLVAVSQSSENSRRANARTQLRQIEEALYGFAQTYGRLPCPALADGTGQEMPVGGGTCTAWHGFVPVTSLGIAGSVNDDGLLLDPWQNPLRYSVSSYQYPSPAPTAPTCANAVPTNANSRVFTASGGSPLKELFNNSICMLPSLTLLCVANTVNCNSIVTPVLPVQVMTRNAPAVIFSMGPNWTSYTSANEQENVTGAFLGTYPVKSTGDVDFVSTDYSEEFFDDQIIWLSPHVLFTRMTAAGKLP